MSKTLLFNCLSTPVGVNLLAETDDLLVMGSEDITADDGVNWYRAVFETLLPGRYRVDVQDAFGSAGSWQVVVTAADIAVCSDSAWMLAAAAELQQTLELIPKQGETHRYRRIAFDEESTWTETAIEAPGG